MVCVKLIALEASKQETVFEVEKAWFLTMPRVGDVVTVEDGSEHPSSYWVSRVWHKINVEPPVEGDEAVVRSPSITVTLAQAAVTP